MPDPSSRCRCSVFCSFIAAVVCFGGASQVSAQQDAAAAPAEADGDDTRLNVEPAAVRFVGFQLLHDNDGWVIDPFDSDDQHYTAGSRVDVFLQGEAIDRLGERLPWTHHFQDPEYAAGLAVSQLIFTARDVDLEEPPRTDRPYAGSLLFHAYIQRFDDDTMDHIELDLGVVGPSSLAEEAQTAIHTARGWDKQLKDEFVFDLTMRKTWKYGLFGTLSDRTGALGWGAEVLPQLGGTLGTVFRQAHMQVMVRGGYNLPGDFGPRRVFDSGLAAPDPVPTWGGYAFARLHGRAVQHNIFLDGNTYRDSRSVDKENFVGEFEFGVAAQLGKHVQLGWSWTALTDEYETDGANDSYATVSLTAHFEF